MNSAYFGAVGSAGGALAAQAVTTAATASARMIRLVRIIDFLRRRRRQSLDEAPRHIGLDHHPAIGGDVADDARDAVEPGDLLAIEFLLAVKGDRNPARVEREP